MWNSARFFGRARASTSDAAKDGDAAKDVLSELADSRDMMEKRREFLAHKSHKETTAAIEHKAKGQKDAALACLKRKKMLDGEIEGLNQRLLRLDCQEHTLSAIDFTHRTMDVERRATEAIKAKLKVTGVDQLDEARAETDEALEDAYELLGVAGQTFAVPGLDQDDDELLDELDQMIQREEEEKEAAKLEQQLLTLTVEPMPIPVGLPAIPPTSVRRTQQQVQEARELEEIDRLAAQMKVEMPMPSLGSAMIAVA